MKPDGKKTKKGEKSGESKTQVMLTQVIICGVLLLVALTVRLIGGGVFGWLSGAVNRALKDDSLLTGLSSRVYGTTTTTTTTVEPIIIETTVTFADGGTGGTSATAASTTYAGN